MATETATASGTAPANSHGAGSMPTGGGPFGHYFIVRPLGGGGMGTVFEAQDLESGRRVALKILGQSLDSPDARERFLREGRLAASINHPNSVYVFGTEEIAGTPVIAMELVPGGTLEERVRRNGPLPPAQAVDAMLQVISGLEAAQRIGILHRDIKPSNCFVDSDGTVKIGDFGLSISTAIRTEPALTSPGAFLGTPAFCSPEQLRGEELNARADMYSLGATLFYLLTGHTPFEAKNVVALLAMVFEQPAPSPLHINPKLPPGLAKVVQRCLEKQPGERFRNYGELAEALAPYSSSAPVPAPLGLRFLAGMIDLLVLGLTGAAIFATTRLDPMALLNAAVEHTSRWLGLVGIGITASVLYYALLEWRWGATVGKAVCGLQVAGPEKSAPGLRRNLLRALIYVVVPLLPMWLVAGFNPKVFLTGPTAVQYLSNLCFYITLALLFCTARKRNGYAAVQDWASHTRVLKQTRLELRPALSAVEPSPGNVEHCPRVGPYHILETIQESPNGAWLLGYDLRLLRKVWLRTWPAQTPPVSPTLRNLGRAGRLRWLTGRRSPEENWDAFEAVSGKSLLALLRRPQPWAQVRFWLSDLVTELSVASKDGSLPGILELDRVWITSEGRAKLLDFPAPGLGVTANGSQAAPPVPPDTAACQRFLRRVASASLAGELATADSSPAELPLRLPLHALEFLKKLSSALPLDELLAILRPLLQKPAVVTPGRRAAIVGASLILPVIGIFAVAFGMNLLHEWEHRHPGLFQLMILLQDRWGRNTLETKSAGPSDRDYSIYIASHYRSLINDKASWSSGLALSLVRGEGRRFAEQSVADYPAPSPSEIEPAEKLIAPRLKQAEMPDLRKNPLLVLPAFYGLLAFYIGVPALFAALLARGGLILLATSVAFVRRDGLRASRLRLFWRSLVAWAPVWPTFALAAMAAEQHQYWLGMGATAALAGLTFLSIRLPERGLPDHLAGTWPVTR